MAIKEDKDEGVIVPARRGRVDMTTSILTQSSLSNARLVRNLSALLDVSKAMAAEVDLDSLLKVILAEATAVMEAELSSLFMYDESTQTLWSRVSKDLKKGEVRIPVGVGIAGEVAQTKKIVSIPDAYQDPRFNPQVDKETGFRTRSILCAPLLSQRGGLIGVIEVLNKQDEGVFTPDEENLMAAFASHAAIALERAQLVDAFVEKQRIEESLRFARDIQEGMLPKRFPKSDRFELAAEVNPAVSVGGDLYDFHLDGERLWFLVGDVSGKGVGAALFMAVTRTLFRASVRLETAPTVVLARMNDELSRDNDQAMFVTVFLGCLNATTGEVVYANAGHNVPYRLGRNGSVEAVGRAAGLALGVVEATTYESGSVRLEPGGGLYLYTDGVTEALNDAEEQFSLERLEAFLGSVAGARAAEVVRSTLTAVADFVGGADQFDDMTVMSVRFSPD